MWPFKDKKEEEQKRIGLYLDKQFGIIEPCKFKTCFFYVSWKITQARYSMVKSNAFVCITCRNLYRDREHYIEDAEVNAHV